MEKKFWIYCVHPMSGLGWGEVEKYYTETKMRLEALGYNVLHPMCAKSELKGSKFDPKARESSSPVVTPHAITRRDIWMVRKADFVFADLSGAKKKSIGSLSEIAIAYALNKHTIGVMEKGNVHEHAFTQEELDIVFQNYDENLLRGLINFFQSSTVAFLSIILMFIGTILLIRTYINHYRKKNGEFNGKTKIR